MRLLKPNKISKQIFYFRPKILKFKNRMDYISDNDIVDLFLGLVNLIKKCTEIKIEEKYLNKINYLQRQVEVLKQKKFIK